MTSSQIDTLTARVNTPSSIPVKTKPSILAYRCMIFYRFALALFGGYVLAALSAIVIAQLFTEYRSSAAMAATLIAFTVHAVVFIWVFMVNKTLKASLGVIVPSLLLFATYKLLGN